MDANWTRLWPWVLRIGGLAGVLYETVFSHVDRPGLLVVFAAMMGLPEFLAKDRTGGGGGK